MSAANSGGASAYSTAWSFTTATKPAGLVAGYPSDEGTGTTLTDVTGHGLTGTISGATWTTQGKYAKALSFNGTSSYVNLGNPTLLQITGSMTVSAWVYATANPADDGQIVSKSNWGGGVTGWQFETSPDVGSQRFGISVSPNGTGYVGRYSNTVRQLNTWYYVAGVYDASGQALNIYVNGVLDNGSLVGTVPVSQFNPNVNVNIGRRYDGSGASFYFIGTIDEVRIYNRALTQAEIQADMNTPLGAPSSPPPAPVLATPANGATGIATNPTLTWNASSGATSYRVQVSTDAGFATTVVDQSNITTTSYALSSLTTNTTYYWHVNATNSGGSSSYSTAWNFTTVPPAPAAPVLVTPANGATGVATNPTLTWNACSGATSYRVQVSTDAGFAAMIVDQSNITMTSYALNGLTTNTAYYWHVNATNSGGTSAYSTAWNFTTVPPPAPAAPVLATPANGATGVATNLTLTWNASSGATSYRVQVSTDAGFAATVVDQSNITATSCTINSLASNTAYYWHVNATNSGGTSTYSTAWSFTTVAAPPPPAAPVLATPANGATGIAANPTLIWNASSGATSYRLQVSTDAGFATTVVDQSNITTISCAVSSLATNTTYYWHVSATNSEGTSAYSTAWSFTTVPPAPAAPVLATPANGATGVATNPTLTWNASSGATSYRLQVSTDEEFATTVVGQSNIATTSYVMSNLAANTTYYWHVNATNDSGTSAYSTIWHFTVSDAIELIQLKYSADSQYLTDQNGTPVFLNGIGSWDLNNITYTDAKRFLDSCYTHSINFLQVRAMSPSLFGGPANAYGVNPWSGSQTFSSTPTEGFWAHMDSVIAYAKTKGIYVMLYPDYLGADASQGWSNETGNSTVEQMKSWGSFIGGRYRNSPNVLWGIGGDVNPTTWQTKLDSMVSGIKSTGDTHLIMTRDENPTTTDTHWSTRSWVTLNGTYPYWTNFDIQKVYQDAKSMRARKPPKPAGLQEAWYENEHSSTATQLRQQSYYIVLGGALGFQIFGNCPNWHFSKYSGSFCGAGDWTNQLDSQGMINQRVFAKIILSRKWYKLIPDTNHVVTTAGYGTWGDGTYVTTAYASDSSVVIAYMPTNRQLTLNTTYIKAADWVRASWHNPATGDSTYIGTYARASSQNFTPSGAQDWVLILDAQEPSAANPPSAPTLASPVNGATGQTRTCALTWNASSEASAYRLQVSTDSAFVGASFFDDSTLTTTSQQMSGLSYSTTYWWHVSAKNVSGSSAYSATWHFRVTDPISPPTAPTLASPTNGASGVSVSPTLIWNKSTNALSYRLQVATDTNFSSLSANQAGITDTSYVVSGLSSSTVYYWHVNATNDGGTSTYSTAWNFTTVVVKPGLAVAYSFNEGSGSTVADASGNNNTGTISGATWTTQGKFSNALSFNGTSSYVALPNSSSIQSPTTAITVSAWVKPNGTPQSGSSVVQKINASRYLSYAFGQYSNSTRRFSGYLQVNGTLYTTPAAKAMTNLTWYYVALIWQSGQKVTLRIYNVNGSVFDSVKTTQSPAGSISYDASNLVIGEDEAGSHWKGTIDEVRIYSRLLTQAEIQNDLATAVSLPPAASTLPLPAGDLTELAVEQRETSNTGGGLGFRRLDEIPDDYALRQNYPNPFNPSTVFEFALPRECHVNFELYNLLGERVAMLVDETLSAGYYSVPFTATGLAGGVYFYRMRADDFVQTKKLLILK